MSLELSGDQATMRDEARRLLATRADAGPLRRAIAAGGVDDGLWRMVGAELGWCAAALPEDVGGLGLGSFGLAILAEEIGRRLAPVPFWSTACLAAPLIAGAARSDARAALLARIAGGDAAAVALPSLGSANPYAGVAVTARRTHDGYALDGAVEPALDVGAAAFILVPAQIEEGEVALFALGRNAGFDARKLESIDLLRPCYAVTFSNVAAPASSRIDEAGLHPSQLAAATATARLGLAAEQVGAAQGCLDAALDHVRERVQFGRTIASFQAIKHRCAALVVAIAEARSMTHGAACGIDARAPEAALDIAAAGAVASHTLFRAAEECIQLHGGAGMTWDYPPHLFLRRAQATAFMLGSTDDRLAEIADAILEPAA